jgi:hypothetical protein
VSLVITVITNNRFDNIVFLFCAGRPFRIALSNCNIVSSRPIIMNTLSRRGGKVVQRLVTRMMGGAKLDGNRGGKFKSIRTVLWKTVNEKGSKGGPSSDHDGSNAPL